MDSKDIDIFVKARKEQTVSELLALASMVPLLALMVIEQMDIGTEYRIHFVMAVFGLLIFSQGPSKWVSVSRRELLGIIERQINRDPAALQLLAEKKLAGKKSRKHLA